MKLYKENNVNHAVFQKNMINKWDVQLNEMTACLSHSEYKQFSFLLKQLVYSSKDIKSMDYLPMIGIYQRISYMLISYINKYELDERITEQIMISPLYHVQGFDSWREAFGYLEKLTNVIFELDKEKELDRNQWLVQSIREYIRMHLSEELNLTVLSDIVNYNSSYVSRIFKQTTGMNLSDYITVCRIKRAKELLNNTSDGINTIAEKVGFDTSQYFCMVFRKEVGMTPSDYRNRQLA